MPPPGGGSSSSNDDDLTDATLEKATPVLEEELEKATADSSLTTVAAQLAAAESAAKQKAGERKIVKRICKEGDWSVSGQGSRERELELHH